MWPIDSHIPALRRDLEGRAAHQSSWYNASAGKTWTPCHTPSLVSRWADTQSEEARYLLHRDHYSSPERPKGFSQTENALFIHMERVFAPAEQQPSNPVDRPDQPRVGRGVDHKLASRLGDSTNLGEGRG